MSVSTKPSSVHARRIDLDVVRGLAILLAVGWHFNIVTEVALLDFVLYPGRAIGWAGVDIFFVLSGFLVGRMILEEYGSTGEFNYKDFFVRRVFRLWPVLYLYLFLKLAAGEPFEDFFLQVALHFQNFFDLKSSKHLWSLAVEEHFYVLLALMVPVLMRMNIPARKTLPIFFAILALGQLSRILGVYLGADPVQVQLQTQYRLDALACGVILGHLSLFNPDYFAELCRKKRLWAGVALGCAAFLANVDYHSALGGTVSFTLSYVMGAALLLLAYDSGVERWAKTPSKIMAFLGQIAYTLYIWQSVGAKAVAKALDVLPLPFLSEEYVAAVFVIATYAVSIIMSWLITITLERPFMALRDRIVPRRKHAVSDPRAALTPQD